MKHDAAERRAPRLREVVIVYAHDAKPIPGYVVADVRTGEPLTGYYLKAGNARRWALVNGFTVVGEIGLAKQGGDR